MRARHDMSRVCQVPSRIPFPAAVKAMYAARCSDLIVIGPDLQPLGIIGPDQILNLVSGQHPEDQKIEQLAEAFQVIGADEFPGNITANEHPCLLIRKKGDYTGVMPANRVITGGGLCQQHAHHAQCRPAALLSRSTERVKSRQRTVPS